MAGGEIGLLKKWRSQPALLRSSRSLSLTVTRVELRTVPWRIAVLRDGSAEEPCSVGTVQGRGAALSCSLIMY